GHNITSQATCQNDGGRARLKQFFKIAIIGLFTVPALSKTIATPGTALNNTLGVPLQIVLLMSLLTLLPAIFMSVTPFLRITVVLHFLRQALGTSSSTSTQAL